jgi:hypothetical protein
MKPIFNYNGHAELIALQKAASFVAASRNDRNNNNNNNSSSSSSSNRYHRMQNIAEDRSPLATTATAATGAAIFVLCELERY